DGWRACGFQRAHEHQPQGLGPDLERRTRDRWLPGGRRGEARARSRSGQGHRTGRRRLSGLIQIATGNRRSKKIRVGIIGADPDRGWAKQAHIPALKSLSDDFEITALSTSRSVSAAAAGKLFGVPLAFDNHHDLVNSAAVDVVAISVHVPYHLELAADALTAAQAVHCEWPLGNGLEEAERLAALAEK